MSKIIDLATFKANLPATVSVTDDQAQQVVDAINQFIETRTNRVWGDTTAVTERYDWGKSIFLRHMDVDPTSIVIKAGWPNRSQYTLDSSAYFGNKYGRITMLTQLSFGQNQSSRYYNDYLEITYSYGVATVPDNLKMAAIGIAVEYLAWLQNSGKDVAEVNVGSYRITYTNKRQGSGTGDQATSTGDANWAVVESYRQRRM